MYMKSKVVSIGEMVTSKDLRTLMESWYYRAGNFSKASFAVRPTRYE